jgi:hypothetical protein
MLVGRSRSVARPVGEGETRVGRWRQQVPNHVGTRLACSAQPAHPADVGRSTTGRGTETDPRATGAETRTASAPRCALAGARDVQGRRRDAVVPDGDDLPAIASGDRRREPGRFRVVHFSVQEDHVHFILEADAHPALMLGIQGLAIRCALAVNRAARRRGKVWSGRYHAHPLRSPSEVRRALAYVLLNFRKHLRAGPGIDPFSSGRWFDGWAHANVMRRPATPRPVSLPRTWLLATGWRRGGGPIDWNDTPATGRRRAT